MANPPEIPFPIFRRPSTMETLPIAAVGAIVAALILPFSKTVAMIVLIPCVIIAGSSVWTSASNALVGIRWSNRFTNRISCGRLYSLVENDVQRFTLHVRFYGGFDTKPLKPAAVLKDRKSRPPSAKPTSFRS